MKQKWINLLSIDGGSSGLVALCTIEEITSRLAYDLKSDEELMAWRHFKLMIGTGHGGLVVILIGRLRLSPSHAIEAYMKLEAVIPKEPAKDERERKKNSTAFKTVFEEVLKEAGFKADTPMMDENMPKIIVCTATTANVSDPRLIRSYRARSMSPSCTILQAACACIASPDTFDPVTIGIGHKRAVLIDAMTGCANPAKELLREAQDAFDEDTEVSSIVSIGAGKGKVRVEFKRGQAVGLSEGWKRGVAMCEQVHADLQGRLEQTNIYYRFNVEQDLGIDPETVLENVYAYLQEQETSSKLNGAINSIQHCSTGVNLKDINSVTVIETALKPRPSLVDNFVGREDVLKAMRQTHITHRSVNSKKPAISVLSGLGGAGKTQTSLKFALEFEEEFPGAPVYFVNASAEEPLKADFENIIRSRGDKYRALSYQDAITWLATKPEGWLMIMDNADDPSFRLLPYIAQSPRGNVIITTRNANHKLLAPKGHHPLEGLSTEDAIDLILTASEYENTKENRALARAIVKLLGHLPLALAQAAGYIYTNQCLSTYVALFEESAKRLLAARPSELPYDYPDSVAMTIQLSLGRLPPHALYILQLFSHLDWTSIPHAIIERAADRKFRRVEKTKECDLTPQTRAQADALVKIFFSDGEWSQIGFNDLITCCLQYSLLRLTTQGTSKFYSMHILVRSYLHAGADLIYGHKPGPLIIRMLGSSTTSNDHQHLAFNRLLLPHFLHIQMEDVVEAGDHAGVGHIMERAGDTKSAILHLEQCVEMWKKSLGAEHEKTLWAMIELAISYKTQGIFKKAWELEEKVLAVRKTKLGEEHPDTLLAAGNLALSYTRLKRRKDAVELGEKVLKARKKVLEPAHPHTVMTMANLAVAYKNDGRYMEAMDLEELVVDIRNRSLGPEHPYTLMVKSNLAYSYYIVGRKEEALEGSKLALDMRKKILGEEHPSTLFSMRSRLVILRGLGTTEQFRELLQVALPVHEKVLGLDNANTVWMKNAFGKELRPA